MFSLERTFDVAPPVAEVFAYLADFTRTEQWDPGTVRTTRTDSGPLGVGARFHNVSSFRGRETELDYELTTYDEPHHLVFSGRNATVSTADDLRLTASPDGGTTIHYVARFDFHGAARFVEPLLRRALRPVADQTVTQLREVLARP